MPELPEVETTRRGLTPHLTGKKVTHVIVRQSQLRWPIPDQLAKYLCGQRLNRLERRAKYLLFRFQTGTLILHLGMSGSLRVLPSSHPATAHDHIDIRFGDQCMRLRDPRRFGAVLWTHEDPSLHRLLCHLGPEPLSTDFSARHLHKIARSRRVAIKNLIMDGKVVVGVGNIYANEALFLAGIKPTRKSNRISLARLQVLTDAIKNILTQAIAQGGTTLRDFQNEAGKPGYFSQSLNVYGRGGKDCIHCGKPLKAMRLGQRSTVYCRHCQT